MPPGVVRDRGRGALDVVVVFVLLALTACSRDDDGSASSSGSTATTATAAVDEVTVDTGEGPWSQFGHDLANSRTSPDESAITPETAADLTPAWAIHDLVGVTSIPTAAGDTAYFGDWTGAVRAVDVATGDPLWRAELGGSVIGSVPVDGDALYASTGVTLHRLDRETGEVLWEATVDAHPFAMISASPVVADGVVLQGVASGEVTVPQDDYTFTGSISAFDAETGDRLWRFDTTPGDASAGAGVGIWSTPAVDLERGVLYVGTGNTYEAPSAPLADSLLALDLHTGELAWSTAFTRPDVWSAGDPRDEDADVGTAPNLWSVGHHDLVGAGDKNGAYHALDRDTGEVVWEATLTPGSTFGGVNGSSAFVDGTLVVTSNIGDPDTNASTNVTTVSALDAITGEQLWQVEEDGMVFAPVSTAPGVAFVATTLGAMLALDAATGDELWRHDAPNSIGAGPTVTDGHLLWGYGYALFSGPGEGGLLAFTLPATTTPSSASAGCQTGPAASPGTTDHTLTSGRDERRYQVTLPTAYDGTEPRPLVLGLHALTVPYTVVPAVYGLADAADRDDFVLVSPSGLVTGATPYWLAAPTKPNHDVAFIADLLDRLEQDLCFDPSRVFATGMSNGGQMSSLLACRLGDRITAVGPVAGVEFSDATCTGEPVPVMAFHGDEDPIVTYEGGGLNATTIADQQEWHGDVPDGLPVHGGVDQAMAEWAAHNGCAPEPAGERISPEVLRRTWAGCEAETVLYVVEGGGHTWPGRPVAGFEDQFGATTVDIDATALLVDFFLD